MSRWFVRKCRCGSHCRVWTWGRVGSEHMGLAWTLAEAHDEATQAARAIHGKICQSCPRTPDDYDCPYQDGYNPGSNSGD